MNDRYFSANQFFREQFGGKTRKISLNAGFNCPNRDGTLDTQGCIYCDAYGSGPLLEHPPTVKDQIATYLTKHPGSRYIAYFQAFSNTYAPADRLHQLYAQALIFPEVKGVFIGTRPDCINKEVLEVLAELSSQTYVCVELGLQSIHDRSLQRLNRHHDYADFLKAFNALRNVGLDTVVHLILGIPGESRQDMWASLHEMNRLLPRGIKLHMLHVLKQTKLASLYRNGEIQLFSQKEYVSLLVDLLEGLAPDIVVHRLTGERNRELFIAPAWALDKAGTLKRISQEMSQRDTWQGKALGAPRRSTPKPNG